MDSQSSFNRSLNGYRGFCALLVFVFHAGNAGVIATAELGVVPDFVWTSLRYGVEMFFMISGYVILGSLLRHASIAQFLSDRFIRIYSAWLPALVAVSLVCAVFNAKMFQGMVAPERFRLFFANLLLLPPFVPVPLIHRGSWSLSYEWVFYLTAAVGAALQRQRAGEGRWVVGVYILLAATFVFLFPRSTFFVTGVVVFMNAAWFESRRQWLRMPWLSMFVFLIAWRFTNVDEAELTITYWDFLQDYRWLAAVVAFLASLHMFASVVNRPSRQFAFLDSRVFQFLGRISYSFYLWHTLVMSVVKRVVAPLVVPQLGVGIGFSVFILASGAVSIAISWLSWTVFEVRMAKAARRIVTAMKVPQHSRVEQDARQRM